VTQFVDFWFRVNSVSTFLSQARRRLRLLCATSGEDIQLYSALGEAVRHHVRSFKSIPVAGFCAWVQAACWCMENLNHFDVFSLLPRVNFLSARLSGHNWQEVFGCVNAAYFGRGFEDNRFSAPL